MSERDREGGGGLENMLRERRMLLKNEKDLKNTREGDRENNVKRYKERGGRNNRIKRCIE